MPLGIGPHAQTPPTTPFQTAIIDDGNHPFQAFPCDPEAVTEHNACTSPPGGGRAPPPAGIGAAMTAVISNITVNGVSAPGTGGTPSGMIGGDVIEFDVLITNTSPVGSGIVLTAYAFQSKFSESPALGSRIGDKLLTGVLASGGVPGQMVSVKKNGTSNGLFSGKWKGICINSSVDFIPEFNSSLEDESLECAGTREDVVTSDANGVRIVGTPPDGIPELAFPLRGLQPGQSQTVRVRLDSGTTDGAAHRIPANSLTGTVGRTVITGPNGITYHVPFMSAPGNVEAILDFGDNKVLRKANGAFDPSFAPEADEFTFRNQTHLTFPRVNFAFTDILGRNHTCGTYGLDELAFGVCAGAPSASPLINFLGSGDLVVIPASGSQPAIPVQNFAAILQGYGEYIANPDGTPNTTDTETRPSQPYGVLCENCGGVPYVPIAEFYMPDTNGQTVTRLIAAGSYGALGTSAQYTATINESIKIKKETICRATNLEYELPDDPNATFDCSEGFIAEGPRPGTAFGATATAHFHDLDVQLGAGLNGGDAIQFSITIQNTSPADSGIYLTGFNYQTKRRGLADINILDGTSQERRDVRLDTSLPPCSSLDDEACWNSALGVGHFPNVIGNGLLFGQMVWPNADAGREPIPVDSDQVFADAATGITPTPFWLESVKKNGPFTPILKGNVNFICIRSGLFLLDPDADGTCAGQPAELADPNIDPIPSNVTQRLGLPPGESQTVRMRMDFGDFRGVMLRLAPGTLQTVGGVLFRSFDCSDQRELEFCHPSLVGALIGYLPSTTAEWTTPATLTQVRYVIVNQPGDAARVMNFADNFGYILRMAGFKPSAEFTKPDTNPALPAAFQGVLIRQQVIGEYTIDQPASLQIVSAPLTAGEIGQPYTYDVNVAAFPAATFTLDASPTGMTINPTTGVIAWTPEDGGTFGVTVRASNSAAADAIQSFDVAVPNKPASPPCKPTNGSKPSPCKPPHAGPPEPPKGKPPTAGPPPGLPKGKPPTAGPPADVPKGKPQAGPPADPPAKGKGKG